MIGQEMQSYTTLKPLRRNCERKRAGVWAVSMEWDSQGAAVWVGLCGCSVLKAAPGEASPSPTRKFATRRGNGTQSHVGAMEFAPIRDDGIRFGRSKSAGGTARGVGYW